MKKIILIIAVIFFSSCTENKMARDFGGTEHIDLPKGQKLLTATWKGEGDLWYLTEDMDSSYIPKTIHFTEKSSFGILSGEVIFKESK